MSVKLTGIYTELEARTDKFNKDIDDAVKKTNSSAASIKKDLGKIAKSFAGIGAAVVIIKKTTDAMKKLEAAAREQERAFRLVEGQVLATGMAAQRTAGQLIDLAGSLQNVSNFSDVEILEGAISQLLKFQNVVGDTFDRATVSITDMASVTGSLQGAAQAVGIALESPIEGINRLRRQGVVFTDTQREQIQNFVETNRLAEAQAVILDKLEGTFGGMAEHMVEPTKQLEMAWGDLQDELGYGLMRAANNISHKLTPAIKEATKFFAAMNYEVRTTREQMEQMSVEELKREIELIDKHLQNLQESKAWVEGLTAAWKVLLGTLKEVGQAFLTMLEDVLRPIGWVIEKISGKSLEDIFHVLSGAAAKESKLKLELSEINAELIRAEAEGRKTAETITEIGEAAVEIEPLSETLMRLYDNIRDVTDAELDYMQINRHVIDNVEKAWDEYFEALKTEYGEDSREWQLALYQKEQDLERFADALEVVEIPTYEELISELKAVIEHEQAFAVIGKESTETVQDAINRMLELTAEKYGENSREYELMLHKMTSSVKQMSIMWETTLAGIGRSFAENLTDAIFDTITQVKSLEDAFKQFGDIALREIGRIITKMLVLAGLQAVVGAISPGIAPTMFAFNKGGQVPSRPLTPQRLAAGGVVMRGSEINRDSVLTALTKGEYVVNRQATASNLPLLESINRGGSNQITAKLDKIAAIINAKNWSPAVNVVNNISPTDINKANNIGKAMRGGF